MNKILHGHVLDRISEIANESIYLTVTSPPYYALRDYGTGGEIWGGQHDCEHEFGENIITQQRGAKSGPTAKVGNQINEVCDTHVNNGGFCRKCGAWRGELGLEPTPELFIDHLMQIFDEVKRVLKPDGSCWVNIGDSFGGSGKGADGICGKEVCDMSEIPQTTGKPKSLIGIPEMFVLAMKKHGWIRRNTIIWYKKSAMPSSAKDRFTVDFEYFYFFTKQPKYYFEQQFEPFEDQVAQNLISGPTSKTRGSRENNSKYKNTNYGGDGSSFQGHSGYHNSEGDLMINPEGRNMRTVWEINPQAFPDAHFAVFPEKLVETPIKACCPEDEIVLDPFMGSGTTAIVAIKQGRKYIGIEANPEYVQMAEKRIKQNRSLFD